MYAIYRTNMDSLLKEWDKQKGLAPVWVARESGESYKRYDDLAKVEDDCYLLHEYLQFACIVIDV